MKLEFSYTAASGHGKVIWEDGVVTATPEIMRLLQQRVDAGDFMDIRIYWGMYYDRPSLTTPEQAWGTIRDVLEYWVGATEMEVPDPPFEPPMEEGVVV